MRFNSWSKQVQHAKSELSSLPWNWLHFHHLQQILPASESESAPSSCQRSCRPLEMVGRFGIFGRIQFYFCSSAQPPNNPSCISRLCKKLFEKWSASQKLRSTKMPFQRTDDSYPLDTLRITLQDFGMPSSFTKAISLSPN